MKLYIKYCDFVRLVSQVCSLSWKKFFASAMRLCACGDGDSMHGDSETILDAFDLIGRLEYFNGNADLIGM